MTPTSARLSEVMRSVNDCSIGVTLPRRGTSSSTDFWSNAYIIKVLRTTHGIVEGPRGAASILDLHPNTPRSRIKKVGIQRTDYEIS